MADYHTTTAVNGANRRMRNEEINGIVHTFFALTQTLARDLSTLGADGDS